MAQPTVATLSAGQSCESLSDAVLNAGDVGMLVVSRGMRVERWNRWLARTSGIPAKRAVGTVLPVLLPGLLGSRLLAAVGVALEQGMSSLLSQKLNRPPLPLFKNEADCAAGSHIAQLVMVKPVQVNERHCLIQVFDVSSAVRRDEGLRQMAAHYRERELHHRAILGSIADGVITVDRDGRVDYINAVAEKLTGWPTGQALGQPLVEVFNVRDTEGQYTASQLLAHTLDQGRVLSGEDHELILIRRDGVEFAIEESAAPVRNAEGGIVGSVLVFSDVSRARRLADQISWQATHDALTGLANRVEFEHRVEQALGSAQREGRHHSLLFLDLDQFKIVNDTCGHVAGDELLRQLTGVLRNEIRDSDTLARLGGDEFGVLLDGCGAQHGEQIADKLLRTVQEFRFIWGERTFAVGTSIGLAEMHSGCSDVATVLGAADAACYTAKDTGRNRVHVYQAEASEAADRHGEMQWVSRIQSALDEDRFVLYAQSIVPVSAREAGGHHEILVRMLDEQGEVVSPGAFIPAAERFNLMTAVDRWVVRGVLRYIGENRERLVNSQARFSINLSGSSLSDEGLLNFVLEHLESAKVPASMICFEVTETAAIGNLASASRLITALKEVGCRFSLDDFGSGLSSFSYLKNLPVDYLKIDGAFVRDMAEDPIDCAMVEAINRIGHVMDIKTIAEFVETDAIFAKLQELGVDFAQGYGIARPQPLELACAKC